MNQVLKYPGSKQRISRWIIENMPPHKVYLEPFAGSLSVLLNKPRCHIETVNDLSGDIVNFFTVLRDNTDELRKVLELTPYSRAEYDSCYMEKEEDSSVECARKFCVKCWQGFGCANLYHNGFKSGQQGNSPNPAKAWAGLPDIIEQAAGRLKGVQIENLPALEIIKRYNTEDVFIYADPPYVWQTRKKYLYKFEMSDEGHIELIVQLKQHPGPVMISGYENDIYNEYLKGWRKIHKKTLAEGGLKRTETLWMNYEYNLQMNLFNTLGETINV